MVWISSWIGFGESSQWIFGELIFKNSEHYFSKPPSIITDCLSQKLSVIIPLIDELIKTKVKRDHEKLWSTQKTEKKILKKNLKKN